MNKIFTSGGSLVLVNDWATGPSRNSQAIQDRVNRGHSPDPVLGRNLGQRQIGAVILGDQGLFCEVPYFWRASFGLFCYHLLAIIDLLIAPIATFVALNSEKTGRMPRKPKPENRALGKLLAQYRERNGETQQELADFLGVARVTVGSYETGMTAMPFVVREKVSSRYGVPEDKLGLTLEKSGEVPAHSQESVRKALLYVLQTSEDPEARRARDPS